MPRPSIGCVISTPGRRSIFRTLHSISYQGLQEGDDIVIVADGHHEPTMHLVEAFGPPFRYEATKRTRTWGHDQLNHGVKLVGGDLLIYQDDDDIFAPRAFDEVRRLGERFPGVPFLGRVKTPFLGLLWQKAEPNALLDGHCLVVPNNKEKLGYFTREYAGDQAWIKSNLEQYEEVYWADRVWTLTRPSWRLFPFIATQSMLDGPIGQNFTREIGERLDGLLERPLNGLNEWTWIFHPPHDVHSSDPVACIRMYQDDERMRAAISIVPGSEYYADELVEFLAWAAQGLPVWTYTLENDYELIESMIKKGYERHAKWQNRVEYIHEWPPTFFVEKQTENTQIIDPRSENG